MNPLVSTLENLLSTYRHVDNVEIELRLGWNNKLRFRTDIGPMYYESIRNTMSRLTNASPKKRESHVYLCSARPRAVKNIRVITDDRGNVIDAHKKVKLETVDFMLYGTPFDLRMSVCTETPAKAFPKKLPKHASYVRSRYRDSWEYKTWTYDLTSVINASPEDNFTETLQAYEFEIELNLNRANEHNLNDLYLAHSSVMKIMDVLHEPVTQIVLFKKTKFT